MKRALGPSNDFTLAVCLVALGVSFGATMSRAADGVIEINQARALAGGVTASDAPGFPVTLDSPGSYELTSDLQVSDLNRRGILIAADDVTLDLRGFSLRGPCPVLGCAFGVGDAEGIAVSNGNFNRGAHVRNGRIRLFQSGGVILGNESRVSDVIVERNGGTGVSAGTWTDVVASTIVENKGGGVAQVSRSHVRNCTVDGNLQGGIEFGSFGIVRNNVARLNEEFGSGAIFVSRASLVRGNVASGNRAFGIQAGSMGNLVIENTVAGNTADGIRILQPGSVQGNEVEGNSGLGIFLPALASNRAAYRENVVNGNAGGTVTAGNINSGGNSCNGTATCP